MWKMGRKVSLVLIGVLLPCLSWAQTVGDKIHSLHGVLDTLYEEMIPMCEDLIDVGRSIGCLGAMFYIASRVWRHILNAEPIDFYPLLRPFVLGFCITFFPLVLGVINGIMKPTVTATAAMVEDSDKAIQVLLKQKEEAIMRTDAWQMYVGINGEGNREKWLKYTKGIGEDDPTPSEGMFDAFGNDVKFAFAKASYNFRNTVKEWLSEILQILFQAASLCINTLRIFQLIVLGILGPLVFALSIYDGLQQTFTAWLAKYLNVYLWLPVANIFGAILGKIQERMLKLDLDQIGDSGDTFFSAQDTGYLVFMLIGIVGYFTVPSVASFIVNAAGGGGMMQKVTSIMSSTGSMAMGAATGGASMVGSRALRSADNIANMGTNIQEGMSGKESGSGVMGAIGRGMGRAGMMMENKLDGDKASGKG
ncbi:conjugative transposon protein TraJ [Chitinophaga japonensis]|uniref:Conjugative transposon TraJ protein n=1 Tax=Chitinophaga japonensis TaxID=104662 RepID=A0A562T3K0_CHIJA|nr:conjugative transposon protein TraJ [Chitinophaga japonensis]TWI87844.1 conjugative transposon TraJ protein [Chitinophaga japonensis]